MNIVIPSKPEMAELGSGMLISVERIQPPAVTNFDGYLRRMPEFLTKGPPEGIVTLPVIQIKGRTDQTLESVSYDLLNDQHSLTNQPGYISGTYYDKQLRRFTTNYFDYCNIKLVPGTNTLTLHARYVSGRHLIVKKVYDLRLDLKTNAPRLVISWPPKNRKVCGNEVTIRGLIDDCSDQIIAETQIDGQTKRIQGEVERDGHFWLQHIPLSEKTNQIIIVVKDVVGNVGRGRVVVLKNDDQLTINPVPPKQLWQMQVTVSGTVSPANREVWINGLKATVKTTGEWTVRGVPMDKKGVAVFDAKVVNAGTLPPNTSQPATDTPSEFAPLAAVSITSVLTTNEVILNASQPTYGTFKIHLVGTAGQSFILQDSTNLMDWSPILTNNNFGGTFDYYDTNAVAYGCRFFRVVPVR